ncbi:MAG: DNA repair protein RecN, partial [Clostridiales Family XIII bacterium]|nr:DNA repair protein RecN [Clostridiales Family XIII bacterium]
DGEIVTLARLREATSHVADKHGQYDHQSLLDPRSHIEVIDGFRADLISGAKARVAEAWRGYSASKRAMDGLLAGEAKSRRELDFLRFEVGDIDAARPRPGEYETLKDELKVMQNSERIFEALSSAYESVSGGAASASDSLARAVGDLRAVSDISGEYKAMGETASEAAYMVGELSGAIRSRLDSLEFSEQAINDTIARIDVLERLMSKYGRTIEDVLEYREKAVERLSKIENIDEEKGRLARELGAMESALASESLALTGLRRQAAAELEEGVTKELRELNFSDAVFTVSFAKGYGAAPGGDSARIGGDASGVRRLTSEISAPSTGDSARIGGDASGVRRSTSEISAPSTGDSARIGGDASGDIGKDNSAQAGRDGYACAVDPADFTENGIDDVEFLISANKGQPPLPVAKSASGGELSRIMLALKSVIGEFDRIPTMVFDEIDAGISGVTASVVGGKLKRMARGRQILCITHLPQIAAFADHHYVIEKRSDDSDTYTTLAELTDEGRVGEIARLIGGSTVTRATTDSARELIAASCAEPSES